MYYFMRQEGTWLFAVIGAVSILLQQWLWVFLAFRAPWQIGRHFLGTQGEWEMGIPRDKFACCMPELHISNIHSRRGNVSIFPLGGLSHPLAWCVTFYSSWCDQVSDKIGQTEAGHIICIMGGADHIMRFVEDLCCLILAGLLDTFIEWNSNLFPGTNITASNSLNTVLMTSTKRSCLARIGTLEEIDLESWVEKPFFKTYQQIFPSLCLLLARVNYLLFHRK